MKKLFKQGGLINTAMVYIYELIFLNFIWVICSIPIITIGASTTALFFVTGKLVRGEEVQVFKDFFKSLKSNIKQSTIIWILLILIYGIIYTNIRFFSGYNEIWSSVITVLQLPVLSIVILTSVYIFPILSRFNVTTIEVFKVSCILSIKHLVTSFLSLILVALIILIMKFIPAFMLFFFISLIGVGMSAILNKVLKMYSPDIIGVQ